MTLHTIVLSVWTTYLFLIGSFFLTEYQILKAQPAYKPPMAIPSNFPAKKNFDYPLVSKENALLKEKNKLITLAYASKITAHEPVTKAEQPKKQISRPARRKRRLAQKTTKQAPLRTKKMVRRRRMRRGKWTYQATQPAERGQVLRGKSSPLRTKPLKNVTIKVTSIKPVTANKTWKKLYREGLFAWPLAPEHFWISSLFGPRKLCGRLGFHAGVDMASPRGTPVYAAGAGIVVDACYSAGYGNYILIAHNRKFKTRYAHLDKILVRVGQKVSSGDCIGRVGATGFVRKSRRGGSASHLHFEVYMKGKPVNPFFFLA